MNKNIQFKLAQASLPKEFKELIKLSKMENLDFLDRTLRQWQTYENQFSKAGEAFYLGYYAGKLVACGGINQDPYLKSQALGRIRHLYVHPGYRRKGIAKELLNKIIEESKPNFKKIRLRSNSVFVGSKQFYLACGFLESKNDPYETHFMMMED
ncbi:MAG: GNAT family N-acetyltransferase [Bdellovibrionota bacterium]|nr:GNAT family N-acetyltransferase [Bdellovibrionota bacterium]